MPDGSGNILDQPRQREPEAPDGALDRFRHGDLDAFETIFRAHQRIVYGWILRLVRDSGAAEDLTVETFWRIYRARARFDPAREFAPWARRVATRVALDWLRARKPEVELTAEIAAPEAIDPAVGAEIRHKVALAFARLPAALRITAELAVVQEHSHKEVAQAMGITVGAVKLRVFRALRLVRRDLEGQGIRP